MSRPSWFERSDRIHRAVVAKMKGIVPYSDDDAIFLAMGVAGEAGEVAIEIEEWYRAENALRGLEEKPFLIRLGKELADVRILLELLSRAYEFELDSIDPKKISDRADDDMSLAAGLFGRVGKVANEVKKWMRGDYNQAEFFSKVRQEMVEVLAYLNLLSFSFDIDLDKVVPEKLAEVEERFRKRGIL